MEWPKSSSIHYTILKIKVAGRSSSFQFKGKNMDLRELGEKLGVRMVLEGSIRKYGNRIRITAQLINVEDGFHIWSEKFDREMNDIFALQDEIAFAITEQLKVNMFENDREKIAKIHTQNAEAYELYLKGRFHTNRRGSSILTGLKCFKQAISIDPGYALAYVGYADANSLSAVYNFLPGIEVMGEVKKSAEKAIQLDPTLSEAYCTLASYHVFFDRDFEKARKNFQHSIELNYQNSQAHAWYGMLLHCFIDGNFEEAEKEGMIAIKLEPLSSINHADLAWTYLMSGRYTDGLTTAKMGIELDANSFLSYRIAGLCYNAMGEFDNAIMLLQKMMLLFNNHPQAVAALIWSYCGRGKTDEARQLMKMLEEKPADFYRPGIFYANSAANLGDLDKAMKYMNKAYQEYDPQLHQLKYAPDVPPLLRKDPRFQELLNKISKCAEPLL